MSTPTGSVTIAVVDIDGVVADVRHRLNHLDGPRKRWDQFFLAAAQDGVLPQGANRVAELALEHSIVWLTGRPEWLRQVTTAWLALHTLPTGRLVMRPERDYRPARTYKLEAIRALGSPNSVAVVLDDDIEVTDTVAAAGYLVEVADWLPRSRTLREAQERSGRT